MSGRVTSSLVIASIVVLVGLALAPPAVAQILPAGAPAQDKCAVAGTALERLTGTSTTTASLPALATPKASTATSYTNTVVGGRGYEISAGAISGDTRYGATFVGDVGGELPGLFFSAINYTPPSPGPGVTNYVTGGEWALCGSWGVLYGNFTDGTVTWNADGTFAEVATNMVVSGGSVNGVVVAGGSGSFGGVLDHTPLAQGLPPTIGGTLQLDIPAAKTANAAALPETGGFPLGSLGLMAGTLLGGAGLAASLLLWRMLRHD